ncbi:MAG: filamentous hemagglutinin N-terminal domain-containing protein, partial [Burkholderiales bacterium]|nr:filamentous hemagglutinin N-terminal domain-containing protein [Burkholderiales bacterium]
MRGSGQSTILRRSVVATAVGSCFAYGPAHHVPAHANPTGPVVKRGTATFQQSGGVLHITNSPNAVIHWQGFSIDRGELTRFLQQHAQSAVLNRVTGGSPSAILGALQSNGRVFLINPNGILFGAGAQVDVAGLIASSLNLADADFLAGRMRFGPTPGAGNVANDGAITTTTGGQVYLIAPNVENSGVVTTPKGEVIIAAGRTVEMADARTPLLRVEVTAPDNRAVNAGKIIAEGGRVSVYGTAIRNIGTISANTMVRGENGEILLRAGKDVTLENSSVVTASGPGAGKITIEAETGAARIAGRVEANALNSPPALFTSSPPHQGEGEGEAGKGGTITIRAQREVTVDRDAIVTANGPGGGTVAIHSRSGTTQLAGRIEAKAMESSPPAGGGMAQSAGVAGAGGAITITADKLAIPGALDASGAIGGRVTIQAGAIAQSGAITADATTGIGGGVEIRAVESVVQEPGASVSASSASGEGGAITMLADRNSGRIVTSAALAVTGGGIGGAITVTASEVELRESRVDASGSRGGGLIRLGGDYQGKGSIPNARTLKVDRFTRIRADAEDDGDGGRVILWSDDVTDFEGMISARGGSSGGNGGFVEVSGKEMLRYRGTVDLRAPRGRKGTLLLDPDEIVVDGGDGGSTWGGFANPGTVEVEEDSSGLIVTIFESQIEEQSKSSDIILQARRSITIGPNEFNYTSSGNLANEQAGVLVLADGASLTLQTRNRVGEAGSINLTTGFHGAALEVSTQNSGPVGAGGNLTIQTGVGGALPTSIALSTLSSSGGNITVTAGGGAGASVDVLRHVETIFGGGVSITAPGTISVSGASLVQAHDNGAIVLTADRLSLANGSQIRTFDNFGTVGAGGSVTIRPFSIGQPVAIEAGDSGGLRIQTTDLQKITTRTLTIGRSDQNNELSVTTAVAAASVASGTLRLVGEKVTLGNGDLGAPGSPLASHLEMLADNDVNISGSSVFLVDGRNLTIRGDADSTGGGNLSFSVTPGMIVGTSVANTGTMTLQADSIFLLGSAAPSVIEVRGGGSQSIVAADQLRIEANSGGGAVTVSTSSGPQTLAAGGGGIAVRAISGATGAATVSSGGGQTISARYVEVIAEANSASITNTGGTQTVTTTGQNAVNQVGLLVHATGASQTAAISNTGTGPQSITVNDADHLRVIAGGVNSQAKLTSSGSQAIVMQGVSSGNSIEIGGTTAGGRTEVSGFGQTITAGQAGEQGSVNVQGGVTDGQNSILQNFAGTQTISAREHVSVLGGAAPGNTGSLVICAVGGIGACGFLINTGPGVQSITAPSIGVEGGDTGGGNKASISASGAGQTLTITGGSLDVFGGEGTVAGNAAEIIYSGTGTQRLSYSGGGVLDIRGGLTGTGNSAQITYGGAGGRQEIDGSPLVAIAGGSGVNTFARIVATNSGTQSFALGATTITGGGATGDASGSGVFARSQSVTVAGNLNLTGSAGATNSGARIGGLTNESTSLVLDVTNGGTITLNGGAASVSGAALGASGVSTAPQDANVTVTASGDINLNAGPAAATRIGQPGGTLTGNGNVSVTSTGGSIVLTGGSGQQPAIRTGAGTLTVNAAGNVNVTDGEITGGGAMSVVAGGNLRVTAVTTSSSIQVSGAGASLQEISALAIEVEAAGGGSQRVARILGVAGQEITTTGPGGIRVTGGGGEGNLAEIRQGGTANAQLISIDGGGTLRVEGGFANTGTGGAFARIQNLGTAQTIDFVNGGSVHVEGGTLGTDNFANIQHAPPAGGGVQTITGEPAVTLRGGASGGAAGQGNAARITANAPGSSQDLALGATSLFGGAGGIENSAIITSSTQDITINGNLVMVGSGGGTGPAGARIGGPSGAATDLDLSVQGSISMSGGAAANSGSALGASASGGPQSANVTVTASGDITLNPGSVAGTRIGQPGTLVGDGNISVTSTGGNINLNGDSATSGAIRTGVGIVTVTAGAGNITVEDALIASGGAMSITANSGTLSVLANDRSSTIQTTGAGTQAVSAGRIVMDAADTGSGRSAVISASAGQDIAAGAAGISLRGGDGDAANNESRIEQLGVTNGQTVTINGGGTLAIRGGDGTGGGNRAAIVSNGSSQTINFAGGGTGTLLLTGGGNGAGNSANIDANTGNQSVLGSPHITLAGGASGGGPGLDGNEASLIANAGTQTITASSLTITGGAGVTASAGLFADPGAGQVVTVSGATTLSGGTGDGSVAFIGGEGDVNVSFTSGGALTITGGTGSVSDGFAAVAGIGAVGPGNDANVSITAPSVTLARGGGPGFADAFVGSYEAGGTISITATTGSIALNDAVLRTTGDIGLSAAAGTISQLPGGVVQTGTTGTLTASAVRLDLPGQNLAGSLVATTTGAGAAGDITFNNAAPLTLGTNAIVTHSGTTQTVLVSTSGGAANGITVTGTSNTNDNVTLRSAGTISFPGGTITATSLTQSLVNTWLNPLGGDWAAGTNWSRGTMPDGTQEAVVPDVGGAGADVTINLLAITGQALSLTSAEHVLVNQGAGLTLGGRTSTIAGALSLSGTLTANGPLTAGALVQSGTISVLTGPGTVTAIAGITWQGGTMSGTGATVGAVTLGPTSGALALTNRTLTNSAASTLLAGDQLTVTSATINGTGSLSVDGVLNLASATIGTPVNSGVTGNINVTAGAPVLTGGGTHSGAINASAGTTLQFSGGTHNLQPGSSLTAAGATVNVGNSSVVNFDGAASIGTFNLFGNGTLGGTANVSITTMGWGGAGNGGNISGSGTVSIGNLNVGGIGPMFLDGRTIQISGTTSWCCGGDLQISGGASIVNLATGVYNTNGAANHGAGTGSGTFINQGILNSPGSGGVSISVPFTNAGTVNVNANTSLSIGAATQTGTFNVGSGATLTFSGAHTLAASSSVTGAGGVTFLNTGTLTSSVNGTFGPGGTTALNAGARVDFNTNVALGGLTMSDAVLGGTGNIIVGGAFGGSGSSTIGGSGTFTIGGNLALDMCGLCTLTLDGRSMTWTGTSGIRTGNGTMRINNGASFTIPAGAIFDVQSIGGSITTSAGAGSIVNDGIIRKTTSANPFALSVSSLRNNGTVDVQTGTLQVNNFHDGTNPGTNAGVINIANGATLTTNNTNLANTGTLGGSGRLLLTTGTAVPTGRALTSSGTINAGSSPGTLNVTGDLVLTPASVTNIEIQSPGLAAGVDYDLIAVTGTVTLDGTLNVTHLGGFTPAGGASFQIMTYAARTGASDFAVRNFGTFPYAATPGSTSYLLTLGGATRQWAVDSDGFWDVAGNWTGNAVPIAGDSVVIDRAGGTFTVTVRDIAGPGAQFAGTLSMAGDERLAIAGDSLTLASGPSTIGNMLAISGGTLVNGGSLTVGALDLSSGTLTGSGGVSVTAAYNRTGGTFNIAGNASINQAAGNLNLAHPITASALTLAAPAGTIGINTGATLALGGGNLVIANTDGARLAGGTIGNATVTNPGGTGLVVPASLSSFLANGVTLGTNMTVADNATLTVTGGLTVNAGSAVTLASTTNNFLLLDFNGGTQTLGGGGEVVFSGVGQNSIVRPTNGGALTIGPGITIRSIGPGGGTVGSPGLGLANQGTLRSEAGNLSVTGSLVANSGTFAAQGGATLTTGAGFAINAGAIDVGTGSTWSTGNTSVSNTGAIRSAGVINTGTGTLTNASGGILRPGASPGLTSITGHLVLDGGSVTEVEISGYARGADPGYDAIDVSGNVTINSGAQFNVLHRGGFVANLGDSFRAISAGGTLSLPGGAGSLVIVPPSGGEPYVAGTSGLDFFLQRGTTFTGVNVWNTDSSGNWNSAGNWSLGLPVAGQVVIIDRGAANPTITVNSAGMLAGRLQNAETLTVSGGSLTLDGNSTSSGVINISGGTLAANAPLTAGTVNLSSGTLGGTGTVTAGTAFNWTGGVLDGAGTLVIPAGASLDS